ncbi:MAG TPA: chloride channel protein [Opitutus sp.]|nr:chloride channel protein [Opitutus sp.]
MSLDFLARWLDRLTPAGRSVVRTAVYGLVAGLIAVAFQLAVKFLYQNGIVRLSHGSLGTFLVGSFIIVAVTSSISGWLLSSFCPAAAGSGIPQLKVGFWKDFGLVPWRILWVKFIGGALSVGGGSSLGREGPSVQLGGGLASNVAGLLGEPKHQRRPAVAAGAAAGLAAAFNTPIASVTFVLEEIIGDLNSRLLGGVLLASVLGALVVHGILGAQPAFSLHASGSPGIWAYAATPLVALLASLAGVVFQQSSLGIRHWNKTPRALPPWTRVLAGGLAVWVLGSAVFAYTGHTGVFSLGYDDLSVALDGRMPAPQAALLLVAKLAATSICYGLGGCGGIFSPTLFFGAMTGAATAGLLDFATPVHGPGYELLAVVGMSSCLAAVVRAPVTSILIVFEMTHEFALVPPLMIAALISQAVARRFTKENFYDALLTQDGTSVEHVVPPRDLRAWLDSPVSRIGNFRPTLVRDTSPAALRQLLAEKAFDRFPVVRPDAKLLGVLTRAEAELAITGNRAPNLAQAPICRREATVRTVQSLLLDSPTGVVLIIAGVDERVIGIVTLHDLLRAEFTLTASG